MFHFIKKFKSFLVLRSDTPQIIKVFFFCNSNIEHNVIITLSSLMFFLYFISASWNRFVVMCCYQTRFYCHCWTVVVVFLVAVVLVVAHHCSSCFPELPEHF